jgi:hypothetical protein
MLLDPVSSEVPTEQVSSSESLGSTRIKPQRQRWIQPFGRSKRNHYIIDLFSLEGEK